MKFTLNSFVYLLLAGNLIWFGCSVYTKDFMSMIPSGYGIFVFGSIILVSRMADRQIKRIEDERKN